MSSIGVPLLRTNPDVGSDFWGTPRPIRSDEFNVMTPVKLSIMVTGDQPTLSPLGAEASVVQRYATSGSILQPLVYFDSTILRMAKFLPDNQLFAFQYWLPLLVMVLLLPRWLEQMGGSRITGWAIVPLVVLAPSVAWWSGQPVTFMAYTLAGSVAMLASHTRLAAGQRKVALLLAIIGGSLIAGIPSGYIPWAVILGLTVLLASTVRILTSTTPIWQRVSVVGATAIVALVLGIGALLEGSAGIEALADTSYPGSRRSAATQQPFGFVFGAPLLSSLSDAPPIVANQSELSTSYTVAFVVWAIVAVSLVISGKRKASGGEWTIALLGALWLGWCSVNLGEWSASLPVVNQVTPERAAQVVGTIGLLGLGIGLSRRPEDHTPTVAILAASVASAITLAAGTQMKAFAIPHLTTTEVGAATIGVGLMAFLIVHRPESWITAIVSATLAAAVVWQVNPVQFGLGELRNSDPALRLRSEGEIARESDYYWASDMMAVDVLMLANAVPSLSGIMRSGPLTAQWERIDPDQNFEEAWNRGAGYIWFDWAPGAPTSVSSPGPDVVVLTADPCSLGQAFPELRYITSQDEIEAGCARSTGNFTWSGEVVEIYELSTWDPLAATVTGDSPRAKPTP